MGFLHLTAGISIAIISETASPLSSRSATVAVRMYRLSLAMSRQTNAAQNQAMPELITVVGLPALPYLGTAASPHL